MDLPTTFLLVTLALLPSDGVCSGGLNVYLRTGEDTTLPCDRFKRQGPVCTSVYWDYWRDKNHSFVVHEGQIKTSPRSSRLTLNPNCSLTVHNISEDDFGKYTCAKWNDVSYEFDWDITIYLNVLSVSPAPSSWNQNGHITLQCTLWTHHIVRCPANSFRWLDMNRTVLTGDAVIQDNCVSNLTVEHQSKHHRNFTCQFMKDGDVQVSVEHRLLGNSEPADPGQSLVFITSAAVVSVLLLLAGAAVVLFKIKSKRHSPQTPQNTDDGRQTTTSVADPENNVTYATIDHQKSKAQGPVKPEETVTYSAVNIPTAALSNHCAIYSNVSETAAD